jgi:hypothetical protein
MATATFPPSVESDFVKHLRKTPSDRRMTVAEWRLIVQWLTETSKPTTQKEHSRLHYVRKHFVWDQGHQNLFAVGKSNRDQLRLVVTEDEILTIVEEKHEHNEHAGWDATWNDVSSEYYGILRSDVIFLLRRCSVCAQNPLKRPKGMQLNPFLPVSTETISGEITFQLETST